jgi:hypothetical protein
MSNQPYDIDPLILQYGELPTRKRGLDDCFIGQGPLMEFSFQSGQPLNDWTITQASSAKFVPQNGYLSVISDAADKVTSKITRPFTTENGSVSLSFSLKVEECSNSKELALLFLKDGSNFLNFSFPVQNQVQFNVDTGDDLTARGSSSFEAGVEYKYVVVIGQGSMKVWQDNKLVLTYGGFNPPSEFYFGVNTSTNLELSNIRVIIGPVGNIQTKRSQPQAESSSYKNYVSQNKDDLKELLDEIKSASSNLLSLLSNISITPWSIFWGIDPGQDIKNEVNSISNNQKVRSLNTRLRNNNAVPSQEGNIAFFIGNYTTFSAVVTLGGSLGYYLNLNSDGSVDGFFAFTPFGGLVTNIGVSTGLQLGIFGGKADNYSGWGSYFGIDMGEAVDFSAGIAGLVPWNSNVYGGYFDVGYGASFLPFDISGGIAYTVKLN